MGLLDPTLFGNLNKLKGLLGETPIGKYVRGQDGGVSINGLKQALLGMPVFDQRAGEQDMAYAADAIGPQAIGLMGKIVYHGSPHKFDKFDASKIGTGEGAQAYGHGVYLADAADVAKSYVDPLYKARDATQIGGLPYDDFLNKSRKTVPTSSRDRALFSKALAPAKSQEEAAANLAELKKLRQEYDFQNVDALFSLAFKSGVSFPQKGALYKADLPDEWIPKMLDWDKPLSEQSPEVQEALRKAWLAHPDTHGAQTGAQIYQKTGVTLRGEEGTTAAAKALKKAGIPGIRYLDGGSRGKGQGTYNYVVFPGLEDQVKILERNGIPINDGLLGRK